MLKHLVPSLDDPSVSQKLASLLIVHYTIAAKTLVHGTDIIATTNKHRDYRIIIKTLQKECPNSSDKKQKINTLRVLLLEI